MNEETSVRACTCMKEKEGTLVLYLERPSSDRAALSEIRV